jgi:P pilus assembly chaperone PapD
MFKNRKMRLWGFVLAILGMSCISFEDVAIGVSPFAKSFVPSKDGKTIQYTLTNNFDRAIAFEIKVFVRKQDINGNDVLEPDDHMCSIYPRQLIVKPKSKRHFKLKYNGDDPEIEKSYRVVITHHDINFSEVKVKESTIAVQIKLQAVASLHVSPADKKSKIEIVSVKQETKDNKPVYAIHVKNVGNTRVLTKNMKDEVVVFGKKLPICDMMAHREHVVLANNEVIFRISQDDLTASAAKINGEKTPKTQDTAKSNEEKAPVAQDDTKSKGSPETAAEKKEK